MINYLSIKYLSLALVSVCFVWPAGQPKADSLTIGMARSGLNDIGVRNAEVELHLMAELNAKWVRFGPRSADPKNVETLAKTVHLANMSGLRVLLNIAQLDDDYDIPLTRNYCGWNDKPLSAINLQKLDSRLDRLFAALHAEGASVDAVEPGNEDDQLCYDGDIGRADDLGNKRWLTGYAHFLQAVAIKLKSPNGFPHAKIVTFGIAQTPDNSASPPHIPDPVSKILELQSIEGVNYLDNADYTIDAIGLHVYPSPEHISDFFASHLLNYFKIVPHKYKIWITEWGFLNPRYFNDKDRPLEKYLADFLREFQKAPSGRLGPLFFYSSNNWLYDGNCALKPAACIFTCAQPNTLTPGSPPNLAACCKRF